MGAVLESTLVEIFSYYLIVTSRHAMWISTLVEIFSYYLTVFYSQFKFSSTLVEIFSYYLTLILWYCTIWGLICLCFMHFFVIISLIFFTINLSTDI